MVASAPHHQAPTISQKKLSYLLNDSVSEEEMGDEAEGQGQRIFELPSLQLALSEAVCCKACGSGSITLKEDLSLQRGLYTKPYLYCEQCASTTYIPFSYCHSSKVLAINRRSVFANRCVGGTHSSLSMFCAMLDLPPPVARCTYTQYIKDILTACTDVVQMSLHQARNEVRALAGSSSEEEIVDILISCDGTWQRRGFSSLFGAVFVIAHTTGKVVNFYVMSKVCAGCQHWESRDQSSQEYLKWKEDHVEHCCINFEGSAPAMEPHGTMELFKRSLDFNIRYTHLISDGDSTTYSLLQSAQPYGPEHPIVKLDCVGYVQKRMGTGLRNLKTKYRGQKLEDGKTIGGAGRLTDERINSLQNYYGDAIRRHKDDLSGMIKAVQATLLHCNSTDDKPRHHLCPDGVNSWCSWQKAKAKGEEYHHHKKPIPEAIIQLLKPLYARLGNPELLKKCLHGYSQNANESLHSIVWQFCPKVLFLGSNNVEMACALAILCFNDGAASLAKVSDQLGIPAGTHGTAFLRKKDKSRVQKSVNKSSVKGKELRRAARRRKKGF